MNNKAYIGGVGMVKFAKPGAHEPYETMAAKAITAALEDAGIALDSVNQAYASYIYGDSCCGQKALYSVGMTGIPVINLNNNCSSGSSAIFLARQAVESGAVDCALAFGFEEMQPGALVGNWADRTDPLGHFLDGLTNVVNNLPDAPHAIQMFGAGGQEYLDKYDAKPELFAQVSVKTRNHAVQNPYSLFDTKLTLEEVMQSKVVYPPSLRRFMCCPPTCGAAATVIMSQSFAKKHGINNLVEIAGQGMSTDTPAMYDSAMEIIGQSMTRRAAAQAFEQAGLGPEDADVVELHDCFTPNEVITYEGLGLCGEGEASKFVADGDNTYGGKFVVNPSGGLMSKGHPIGATGLAQCTELVWHLRGQAEKRQVENAQVALQHNLGLGGAAVVTVYKKV